MKNKPQNSKIEYLGISTPQSPSEIAFEIAGLKSAIAEANKRISLLEQAILLAKLATEELKHDNGRSEEKKEN